MRSNYDVKIMQLYFHRNEAFLCSLCHLSAAAHAKLVPKGGNYGKPLCNHLWVLGSIVSELYQ